jgi:MFS family permease
MLLRFRSAPLADRAVRSGQSCISASLMVSRYSVLSRLGLSAEQSVSTDPKFRRAGLLPLAMLNHLALGSVFAWSIFNKPLTRIHGVVVPSADDWALSDVSLTFSLVMGGFVWGAILSNKLDQWGPRFSCLAGSVCLGSGFGLAALAANTGSLPVLFAGGAVWGVANGLAYVPPVAMLLKWYPERKGFASGAALVGFGGGALVAAPLFSSLLTRFREAPQYLGSFASTSTVNRDGRLFVGDVEAVVATAADLATWPGLQEGLYAVNTGSTGAATTLAVLGECAKKPRKNKVTWNFAGAGYAALMAAVSIGYRLPASNRGENAALNLVGDLPALAVEPSSAVRTPQFLLLWAGGESFFF